MAKRFFDTDIWTRNVWFMELKPESKLFWFYLIGNCDSVGVWQENWKLASFIIGTELDKDKILSDLNGQIYRMSSKEIWIVDFCDFQYKDLRNNPTDKPKLSYIELLKKHSLWELYLYGMDTVLEISNTVQEKEQEEDKEKCLEEEKDRDQDREQDDYPPDDYFENN